MLELYPAKRPRHDPVAGSVQNLYTCFMKRFLVLFILLAASSLVFADIAVKDGMVTADLQAEQLHSVITQIGTAAGMQTSIDSSAANELVYANFKDMPIGAAIRKLLEGTDINYAVIGGADGKPTAIFISRSESPGTAPKRLDTRPLNAAPQRGVVQPMSPPPMPNNMPAGNVRDPRAQGQPQPQQQPGDQKPNSPYGGANNTVPTAGSFSGAPLVQPQPVARPDQKPEIQNDNSGDDDDDDSNDE